VITRKIRLQLLALVVVTLLGVGYVSFRYLDVGSLLGTGRYPVTLQLTHSGGIFSGADVTYRGVSVGRVGDLRLTHDGVEAVLDIDGDAPPIPADLEAAVTNLSAIGEQYVDLRPVRADGPTLASGSVIPASRVSTPVPVENLVLNLDTFVRSVPLDSLRTVVDEVGTGFTGTGPELQALLDNTGAFTKDAVAALPQTVRLIKDGRTVLQTQNEQSSAITSFSSDLRLLAEQLRSSDPDIRRLIHTAPQFGDQTSELLSESGGQLSVLVADLVTASRIAEPRQAGLRQLLSTYPAVTGAATSSTLPGDGYAHLGLVLDNFDPFACVRGYESTPKRSGADATPVPANRDAYCAEPPGGPVDVRGAQNVPRAGVPAAVPPGGSGQQPGDGPGDQPAGSPGSPAPSSVAPTGQLSSLASILES
jgi:phospholipid/cholesterol/gamma-HCH transport system substrate-binding protein